jgi:hypothetical protein
VLNIKELIRYFINVVRLVEKDKTLLVVMGDLEGEEVMKVFIFPNIESLTKRTNERINK